jgi:hypothetical protein
MNVMEPGTPPVVPAKTAQTHCCRLVKIAHLQISRLRNSA